MTSILISHRLFTGFGDRPIEKISHLGVNAAAGHVTVLGHGGLRVTKVVGADSGRQALVVDQCGDRLAEAVGSDFRDYSLSPSPWMC